MDEESPELDYFEAVDFFAKYLNGEEMDDDLVAARAASLLADSSRFHKPTLRFFPENLVRDDIPAIDIMEAQDWLFKALFPGYTRILAVKALAEIRDRKLPPKVIVAIEDFELTYFTVKTALGTMDSMSMATQSCFDMLLQRTGAELGQQLAQTLPKWLDKPRPWLDEFDKQPEWMEIRGIGKDSRILWKVSAEKILDCLARLFEVLPDRKTIDRERRRRHGQSNPPN